MAGYSCLNNVPQLLFNQEVALEYCQLYIVIWRYIY